MLSAETVTPLTQGITFAAAGGFFTVVTLLITNRAKHDATDREHALRVEDETARRSEKEADLAAAIAKEARDYARQDEVARRAAVATQATMTKLLAVEDLGKVTHALVNSDKTAALKDQRDALMVTLALMREVVSLKVAAGREPTAETNTAISAMEARLVTLESTIADRTAQQKAAEVAIATGAADPLLKVKAGNS